MTPLVLVPAVKLWPNGAHQQGRGQPQRLDTPEQARRKLASGIVAWVRAEDVTAVTEVGDG
jgi:hypothetical protein